jgi:hypothetical protein
VLVEVQEDVDELGEVHGGAIIHGTYNGP